MSEKLRKGFRLLGIESCFDPKLIVMLCFFRYSEMSPSECSGATEDLDVPASGVGCCSSAATTDSISFRFFFFFPELSSAPSSSALRLGPLAR